MTCAACGLPMVPQGTQPGALAHLGRGLCRPCYFWMRRRGRLAAYDRRSWPREDLLHEVAHLRSCGESWPRVAERLGIKYHALQRAMERARAAGDARAASFRGMAS